ncbi:hypothetical protein U5817_24865 [Aromatoleum evansii]|uniref:Uncharacterized protein n=1 Tax=Aromatoleum evansii TaxID=59406 RepID=A0ABZ1AM82_AROEV|nr:hypothetical protein U5817_24865 [Aromatoleum evansii]
MRTFLIAFSIALMPLSVIADSSLDDLSNDKVLEGAIAEIYSMKARELEVAIEYIAACMEPPSTERNYHCGRNFTIASIKIDNTPQFTKLSKAVFLAELRSKEVKEKGSFESIGASAMELRRSSVFFKLQDAVRERYQKISK